MGLFDKLFTNKSSNSTSKSELLSSNKSDSLDEVAQIAKVVNSGLENQDYLNMNQQLLSITSSNEEKSQFVFICPNMTKTVFALIFCVIALLAFSYFLFIGVATTLFSREYMIQGIVGIAVSLVVILLNIFLTIRMISSLKYNMRFTTYCEVLEIKRLVFIDDLTSYSKQRESIIINDLIKSVKQKLIPQGHFSRDQNVFMVSEEIYNRYMEKPAAYDRYFQKKIEERKRAESRTKTISEIMERGEQYIKKLNDYRVLIKDKVVSKKVEKLVNIVTMVFREIDINPSQAQSLSVFLNYYLPTTEKLLETYVSIAENNSSENHLSSTKKEIEESLNTIITSYEGVLARLYEDYEMVISSEIDALEIVMKKENSII